MIDYIISQTRNQNNIQFFEYKNKLVYNIEMHHLKLFNYNINLGKYISMAVGSNFNILSVYKRKITFYVSYI